MTREDIIRMAREAGIRIASPTDTIDPRNVYLHELERFFHAAYAAGVKAEREAALDLVDDYAKNNTDLRDAIRARGET